MSEVGILDNLFISCNYSLNFYFYCLINSRDIRRSLAAYLRYKEPVINITVVKKDWLSYIFDSYTIFMNVSKRRAFWESLPKYFVPGSRKGIFVVNSETE